MPWRLIIIFCGLAAIILLGLYARAGGGIAAVSVDVTCDDFIKQGDTVSQEIEVDIWNDFLLVSLCSNPTTGFQWELTEVTDEDVLGHKDNEYMPPEAEEIAGASGQEVWTFQVFKAGSANISMEYSRPGEGGTEAARKFHLVVNAN